MNYALRLTLISVLSVGLYSCKAELEKKPANKNGQTAEQLATEQLVKEIKTGNPILDKWPLIDEKTPSLGGMPPWDKVDVNNFAASLDKAFELSRLQTKKIAENPEAPTFDNTILAFEKSGKELDRVATLFFVHASNLNKPPIPDLLKEYSPKFSALSDEFYQNPKLFARVKTIYNNMDGLNSEQKRLVEIYYQGFVRQGANLSDADKKTMSELNAKLASLTTQFAQNVLHDEENYITWIEDKKDLAGLPDWLVKNMASAAENAGKKGIWAITNTRSSMEPFLTYSANRKLREKVWNNYYNRGDNGDEYDNNKIITEILQIRDKRAKLLGYKTHAHWKLENQMAKTPENAIALMEKVWPHAIARVKEEVAEMQAVADKEGANIKIAPWDYRYYAEKVRKAKYDLDFNEVKPYLELENLREGMMFAANKLYGFNFKQLKDIPVFHEDVRVWQVTDENGKHIGLWYFDPYARKGKRSGAWMNAYQTQEKTGTHPTPVIVSNNSNFIKGKPGEPVLISWDDAETMFHEFGHALHGLNSNVTYPTLSGTRVSRDYVEFPSQINEYWLTTPEVLNNYLLHYKTGKPIPKELIDKIKNASKFRQGFNTTEYLASALIDMKLHMAGGDPIDPDKFERENLQKLGMPEEIVMRHRTPHFGHIFSSGYHAGYYAYLWADTLTADTAEAFKEAGSFYDKKTAQRLKKCIMSVGNTIAPAEGFRCFRGRDVDVMALMRDRGFASDK